MRRHQLDPGCPVTASPAARLGHSPVDLDAFSAQLASYASSNSWTPPPRFVDKRFSTYRIDPHIPGQAEAVAAVQAFAAQARRRGVTDWLRRRRKHPRGCYLDGDFGVGKTHLLAASWHAAPGSKTYASFAEAIHLAIRLGPQAAIESLAADLVCIDEFELDDPSNTRLADLLCDGLSNRGCRLLVTSNTVPGELGAGRLFVDQFRAQLVRISSIFTDIHVPGNDYRRSHGGESGAHPLRWHSDFTPQAGDRSLIISAAQLDQLLMHTPLTHLRHLHHLIDELCILDLDTFPEQLSALRFVHCIDRCYDACIRISARAHCAIDEVFHPEYRNWAFAKKYRRCQSRLQEACRE
ncbi:MAG: cell division protein ZapE [Planctomycetota bacterium]|nr:MAG: cell division protein ZapE [Planctomycetota bacterium]